MVLPVTVLQVVFRMPGAFELAENGVDAAGALDILHMVVRGGRHFAQAGHAARNGVNARDVVRDARLARDGQRVENGVRGAPHGDIQRERIVERLEGGDVARLQVRLDQLA